MTKAIFISLFLCAATVVTQAQGYYPNLSPHTMLIQEVGHTEIVLKYDRPAARGRKIFGELIPYGKLWRTGAAYATTISFSKDIRIEDQTVKAGNYALFTIPNEHSWELILNKDTTLYGAYDYNKELDVLKVSSPVRKLENYQESLTFSFDIIPNDAILSIAWENTLVAFSIETTTNEDVMKYVNDSLLTEKETIADRYIGASSFMTTYNMPLETALKLVNLGFDREETEYAYSVKQDILTKLGRKEEARTQIHKALDFIKNRSTYSKEDKELSIIAWNKKLEKQH